MRVIGALVLVLWVLLSLVNGEEDKTSVEVVGLGECSDCAQNNNFNSRHAVTGNNDMTVSIDCMSVNGKLKRRGVAQLDEQGKFKVSLPSYLVNKDGELKEECYAHLHRDSSKPCPVQDSIESARIVAKSIEDGKKKTFGTAGKLKFTHLVCASSDPFAELFGYPLPPCPPFYKKPVPPPVPVYKPPPVPIYHKPLPPPVPIYHKPLPPPVPIYHKPLPPPVPIIKKPCPPKKPLPPVYKKPLPPPVPVYTKPLPPPTPIVKPLRPPIPYHKPLLPFPTLPPKPPCPPLPPLPPFLIPPKYWKHPFLGKWPPLPPYVPPHT